ncbi:plasmid mobilization protein [Nostoc sp.]|uniref:plasmid mobilization protein n=1 Tax=Nostoc sp. TaxID=1180 RepID=UPI002FF1C5A0
MDNQRTTRKVKLQVWLTEQEHELLQQAATTTGQGMSSYVRANVLKAIKADLGVTVTPQV